MNLRLFLAIFFLSFAAIIYMIGKPRLLREHNALEEAVRWEEATDKTQQLLLVTGGILPRKDTTWQDLIVANHEKFTGTGKLNGWAVEKSLLKPFYVKTNTEAVPVKLSEVPGRGKQLIVIPLEERTKRNRHIRLKGLKAGSQVTLIGKFDTEEQLFIPTYAYADALGTYVKLLEDGNDVIDQIIVVLVAVGVIFMVWYIVGKRKKKKSTPQ